MQAKTALECKKLSKEISNYDRDRWKQEAWTRCEEGNQSKVYAEQRSKIISPEIWYQKNCRVLQ